MENLFSMCCPSARTAADDGQHLKAIGCLQRHPPATTSNTLARNASEFSDLKLLLESVRLCVICGDNGNAQQLLLQGPGPGTSVFRPSSLHLQLDGSAGLRASPCHPELMLAYAGTVTRRCAAGCLMLEGG
jgi:hypothetical protein